MYSSTFQHHNKLPTTSEPMCIGIFVEVKTGCGLQNQYLGCSRNPIENGVNVDFHFKSQRLKACLCTAQTQEDKRERQ